MRSNVVKIGNSRGVRIPKPMLEQARIADAIEMTIEAGRIVISPASPGPRAGWAEKLDHLSAEGGAEAEAFADLQDMRNSFDDADWTWPDSEPDANTKTNTWPAAKTNDAGQ